MRWIQEKARGRSSLFFVSDFENTTVKSNPTTRPHKIVVDFPQIMNGLYGETYPENSGQPYRATLNLSDRGCPIILET